MKSIYLGKPFLNKFNILFSYLYHKQYKASLLKDLPASIDKSNFKWLPLISNATFFHKINLYIKNKFFQKLFKSPFYIISNCGFYFFWNAIVLIYFIKKTKPSIVHINNGGFPASEVCNQLAIILKLFFPSIKIIFQVNGYASKNSKYFAKIINWSVSYFITHSEFNRLRLLKIGMSDFKVKSFPSFFDDECPADLKILNSSKYNIATVGFLEKRKGHIYLIQALNKIKIFNFDLYNMIHLHIIGSGEEYQNLLNYIEENNLHTKVTLWGMRSDYLYFIKFSDVFVLPSIYDEDLPLVLLSAMKYNKKIISTKLAGIGEILSNGVDALLVDIDLSNISYNLGIAIVESFTNYTLSHNLAINIKNTYDTIFSEKIYFNNLDNLYMN
jgi:glycosyltransferase involved in cell wall biosynthesis